MDPTRLRTIRRTTAALAALLLTAGVGAALTREGSSSTRVFTSAGQGSAGQVAEEPTATTVGAQPDLPPPPTTVAERTTPTAQAPSSARPLTSTPKASAQDPASTAPPTTAASTSAMVTLANNHSGAVTVRLNGKSFQLAPGQIMGPVAISPAPSGNDEVNVSMADEPECGVGDGMGYFPAGASVRFTVTASPGLCRSGQPGPNFVVSPA